MRKDFSAVVALSGFSDVCFTFAAKNKINLIGTKRLIQLAKAGGQTPQWFFV